MYFECRHVMPNGARCHSPALRDQPFCYFHTRMHDVSKSSRPIPTPVTAEPLILPVIEDRSAVQVAISEVLNALGAGKLDRRTVGIYLYGLQIASQNVERKQDILPFKAVEFVTRSRNGEELAPKLRVCEPVDKCDNCEYRQTCPDADPEEDPEELGNLIT